MWLLTFRDLSFRTKRFVVVVTGTSLVFTLLFLMNGLVEQFNKEPFLTVESIGAATWVVPAGVSGPFTSSATIPAEQATVTNESLFDPVVVARATLNDGIDRQEAVVIGHVIGGMGSPPVQRGRAASRPGELTVDGSSGTSIGDTVGVGDASFEVVGLTSDTTLLAGLPVIFLPLEDARQALFGGVPVISALVTDVPAADVPDDLVALSADEVALDAFGPLENAVSSVDLISALLWVVAAVIIGGVLYLTAMERQRDFAVLKAIGGRSRQLAWSLTVQAIFVSLLAVSLAVALQALLVPVFPLTVRVPTRAYWQLPALAVGVSFLAAQAGVRRVRRTDPVTAFGGP